MNKENLKTILIIACITLVVIIAVVVGAIINRSLNHDSEKGRIIRVNSKNQVIVNAIESSTIHTNSL